MQLDSTFAVTAPIDRVWLTLMDFEKVAGCVPGAQVLNKLSEDAYQVGMKVKLGPVTMQYKGQMEVVERDEGGHRAVLKGQAKEARGQGTAQATAQLALVEDAGTTRGTVRADVALSGRAAAMGQSIIGSVTDQMMAQFADNLQAMLNDGGPSAAAPAAATPAAVPTVPSTPARPSVPAGDIPPPAAARPAAAPPADSLDALALVRGMLDAQLGSPRRVVQLLALVAVIAYGCGRRAGRRRR